MAAIRLENVVKRFGKATAGGEIIAGGQPATHIRAGDRAELLCDLAEICLYEAGTGDRLGRVS